MTPDLAPEHRDQLPSARSPRTSYRDQVISLEEADRLEIERLLGVNDNAALVAELKASGEPTWDEMTEFPASSENISALARQLFKSSKAVNGDTIVVEATGLALNVAAEVLKICDENDVTVKFDFVNYKREAILAKHLSTEAPEGEVSSLQALANHRLAKYEGVTKALRVITTPDPTVSQVGEAKKSDLLANALAPIQTRLRSGDLHYIITLLPTESDAKLDGMEYEEYVSLFLESCDQPWAEIKAAQTALKDLFNRANRIHITNDDGTDLTLDITGQTFANSVVLKNLPGSEIFSAPLKEGTNGRIVSEGRFQFRTSGVIEDIELEIVAGKIVNFDARVNKEALERLITMDDQEGMGSRYLGEIGIGTNPHLRRHLINRLLVEKIGGSFHVAIGSCYSYSMYDGEPVSLQNGNKSKAGIHWDVTTLLRGKGGKIELIFDEPEGEYTQLVQDNGEWLVPGCDVLNQGWNARPFTERPGWWNEKYPEGYK